MARGRRKVAPTDLATEVKARQLESEEKLLLAVLEQAVSDLDHSSSIVRADADAYFFAKDRDYGFSFDSVCSYFKLSPEAVRSALLAKRSHRSRGRVGYRRAA